eukprot:3407162-Rhodomonas_salina.1
MAFSLRAYMAMRSRVITFCGAGFASGFAMKSIGWPRPHSSFMQMIQDVGGWTAFIDTEMLQGRNVDLTEMALRKHLHMEA